MKKLLLFVLALIAVQSAYSGKKANKSAGKNLSIEMDTVFCNKLLPFTGGNVTGADGAISIDLKDGRSMFMWGDSFFGDVVNDVRQEPIAFMMGNVFTIIDKNYRIKNYYQGTPQSPSSYIKPEGTGYIPTWYWPVNGFVRDGIIYLFMSQFHKQGEGTFGFEYDKCDYFTLDSKTMKVLSKTNLPAANQNGVHYGNALHDGGKYVYIYGTVSDNKVMTADAHVARCKVRNQELKDFEYWDGKGWNVDPMKTAKIEGLTHPVAEQFNVVKLKGKYVLVAQDRYTMRTIYSYISDSPAGPFRKEKLLLTVNEPNYEADQMMTYNTMVHPQYIKNGKVLMNYSVNTFDLQKVAVKASVYRPRFFWVPIDLLIQE